MTDTSRYYHPCSGCGRTYGLGNGRAGLARHDCDGLAVIARRLAEAGVRRAQIAEGLSRSVAQIAAMIEGTP